VKGKVKTDVLTLLVFFTYTFPIRITSANIPEAVTAAPAPAPFINNGWST
jgi:hypothetical protein